MTGRRNKRKKLIQGDRILMFCEPRRREPVRIDRSVPATWEEYEQLRDERRLEDERSKLFAALRSASTGKHGEHVGEDAGATIAIDEVGPARVGNTSSSKFDITEEGVAARQGEHDHEHD